MPFLIHLQASGLTDEVAEIMYREAESKVKTLVDLIRRQNFRSNVNTECRHELTLQIWIGISK